MDSCRVGVERAGSHGRHGVFLVFAGALLAALTMPGGSPAVDFLRGDVDGSGRLAIPDAVRILLHLFQGDGAAVPCEDAADVDDSGAVDIADGIHLLSGLFLGGPIPPAPFPSCGSDPTEDALGCDEACPPLTTYFGKEFRADGLFFVIDRSGTMQAGPGLSRAKQETARLIEEMPPGLEFAVVFSDARVVKFPESGQPAETTEEMKASGAAFVRAVGGGSGSCDLAALLVAIDFATNSRARSKALFYVTDGLGACMGLDETVYHQRILTDVTAANSGQMRIHAFDVAGIEYRRHFLEELSARNGGTYTLIRPLP